MIILIIAISIVVAELLNMFTTRIPCEIRMIGFDSRCIECDTKVNPLKKLAVVGIFLKCKTCGKRLVGFRNLFVLLITIFLFVFSYYWFKDNISNMVLSMIFISFLIPAVFVDLECLWIPDRFHVLIALLAITGMFFKFPIWYHGLIGSLIGGGLFLITALIMNPRAQQKYGEDVLALGMGDVKLMFSTGLFLGYKGIIIAIISASIIGVLIELPRRRIKKNEEINFAFGPYLALGMVIALYFSSYIIEGYLELMGV